MRFSFIKSSSALALLCFLSSATFGQTVIPLESKVGDTQIALETKHTALVLENGNDSTLRMVYFGDKLQNATEYKNISKSNYYFTDYSGLANAAYTPSGSKNISEPAISIIHANGDRSMDLRYVRHSQTKISEECTQYDITLKDPAYDVSVVLHYAVYPNQDVIEQWSTVINNERKPVVLEKFASANLTFRGGPYWLKQFYGDWAHEMNFKEQTLTPGIKVLDSKLGTRTNLLQPPSFMVSFGDKATEEKGTVLLASLAYSGNFKTELEVDYLNNLRIISGINNYASKVTLSPKEDFETPKLVFTLSTEGKGKASRNLHNWVRKNSVIDGDGERFTLLNNWEATYFDFNEKKLKELLKDTKELGVDLFLLDDGWFGNKYPRNSDHSTLGDWEPNKTKLPNGLTSLVKEAANQGVRFGIWVEPEMVSPKSVLYETHPNWVIKNPKRGEYYFRNQLVLDLSNPEVQDFVFKTLDDLFVHDPEIAYVKWDCNSIIYNAYSHYLGKNQGEFYISYVEGLYNVLKRFRAKYPKVPVMLCSGGGGRVDYQALKYFTEFWPSDNTDPLERIFMQYEYSYFFPAIATSNHVTDWGKQPLKFRTDVAMMGKLGFDLVIGELSANDLKFAQQAVKNYNSIKDIIWHGELFRLADPNENDFASLAYVNMDKSKAVMFNYLVNNRYGKASYDPIKFHGLDASKQYKLEEINLYPETKSSLKAGEVFSGDYLMKVGYNPKLSKDRASVIITLTAN